MSPRGGGADRSERRDALRGSVARLVAGALALGCAHAACTHDVDLLGPRPPLPGDAATGDAPTGDAPTGDVMGGGDGAAGPSCRGLGDPVRFLTASGPVCAATLAARAHRTAICSCSDWTAPDSVLIIANPSMPGNNPAPAGLGVNGSLTATADLTVPGAVYASGAKGVMVTGRTSVAASLRSGGPVIIGGPGPAAIGTDVYAAGDVLGPVKIGGTLHLPSTATIGAATVSSATVRETVSVPPPCDCTQPFDIAAAISAAMATNDNAARGLTVDRLANVTTATPLDLPCGVYAFSSIAAQAPLTLIIHGRVLIAVAGDVSFQRGFVVMNDPATPGAELDLLLQGSFTASGSMLPVGASAGELLRIWMKGPGPISVPSWPILGAIVNAPNATVMAPAGLSLIGSITAGSLLIGGPVGLTYDDAVLGGGVACGDPQVDPLP